MIYQDIQITVNQGLAQPDKSLYIFRGDSNIILNFKLVNPEYKLTKDSKDNLVTRFGVDNFELRLQLEKGYDKIIRGVITEDGCCRTQLTQNVIQELRTGTYSYQITLIDDDNNAIMTFPICKAKLNILDRMSLTAEELAVPGGLSGEAMTDLSVIVKSEDKVEAFDSNGNYIKTNWSPGDVISSAKLNKIEDALDKINQNEKNDIAVLENNKADVEYVDTKVKAVASGAPKGVYATLAELQYAKPNGDSNIYIISEDGCWYYWKGSSWTKGGVYQGIQLEEHSVKMNHVDGIKQLNKCTPETIVMGAYINTNYVENPTAGTAYAKIPIIPEHTYVICRYGLENQGSSMTSSIPFSITSIDGTNLVTAREDTIYTNVDNNNVRCGIFTAPANSAYLNFNVWINAVNSIESTYCYDVDEIGRDFNDLESHNTISRIFDTKLKDEDIRNEFKEFTNSIHVTSADIYAANAVFGYGEYVDIQGRIPTAEGWAYARVKVSPNAVYTLYFPSEIYTSQRGCMRYEDKFNGFISVQKWDYMHKTVVDNHVVCTFTTPENCHYICFSITAGASQDYAYDDSHNTILVEGTMTVEDFIPFVDQIDGKKILTPTNLNDYVAIPTISTTWDSNKLQNGDSVIYNNALYDTTPILTAVVGWVAARIPVSGGTTYYFYSPTENYRRGLRGAMVLLNENDAIIGEIPGQGVNLEYIDDSIWQKIETTEETAYVGITIRRPDREFDDVNTGVFISDYPTIDIISPTIKSIDGAKLPVGVISGISTSWDDNLFATSGTISSGFLYNNVGAKQAYAGWSIIDISVVGGNTYYFYSPSQEYRTGTRGAIVLINSNDEIIKSIEGQGSDYYTPLGSSHSWQIIKTTSDTVKVGISIIRPDGGFNDVNVGVFISEEPEIYHEEPRVIKINDTPLYSEGSSNSSSKPLLGVKWVVVGDSLTEKNIRATKNYHDYVSEDTGVTVVNMGVSGTGYMRRQDTDMAFYQRILNIPTDTDIVTIFGSGNDLSQPLGTPSDTGTDTICGCMHQTIQNLFSVLPGVRVGIVLPCPWGNVPPSNKGNRMQLYCEALKEIAAQYSIPVLDLYYGSNLRPWDPTFRDLYYKRDDGGSVHPDEDGHKILANKFKMFIQSL